jgi:hypothetical protein
LVLYFFLLVPFPCWGRQDSWNLFRSYTEHKSSEIHIARGLFGFHLAFQWVNWMKYCM